MDALFHWIAAYGYFAIFGLLVFGIVGLPVPDETLLVFSGYLISRGSLHPLHAFAAAFAGTVCGISTSYVLGRTLGLTVIHRYGKWLHITEAQLARVHDWFTHLGHWALLVGYFIPGVRHFTAIVAGSSRLEYSQFARYAYAGASLWVTTFLCLGYFLGDHWEPAFEALHRNLSIATVVLAAALLLWYLLRRWLRSRRPRP